MFELREGTSVPGVGGFESRLSAHSLCCAAFICLQGRPNADVKDSEARCVQSTRHNCLTH